MSQKPTYRQIALTWSLWQEYADPSAAMSFDEWQAMDPDSRIDLLEKLFGPEDEPVQALDISPMTDFLGRTVYSLTLTEDERIVSHAYARSWDEVLVFAQTRGVSELVDENKKES